MEIRIRHVLITERSNAVFHDLLRAPTAAGRPARTHRFDGAFERDVVGDGDGDQQPQVTQAHAAQPSRPEHSGDGGKMDSQIFDWLIASCKTNLNHG
jgi:hypothetical protein